MSRIASFVEGLVDAWTRRRVDVPVSAVVTASLFDVPYLATTLPHVLRQARFAFAERIVVVDSGTPQHPRGRAFGSRDKLERIVEAAKADGTIDRVIELDTTEAVRRDVLGRYFARADIESETARTLYNVLFGLEAARHEVVAWFAPDLLFHANGDGWVTEGLAMLARDRDTWLVTTHSGRRAEQEAPRWARALAGPGRSHPGMARHILCDRQRLHGTLRAVPASRGLLGHCLTDTLTRHHAGAGLVDRSWHLQPVSHAPPFAQWIDRLVGAVERGELPAVQRDGALRLHQPTARGAWRQQLFAGVAAANRAPRRATVLERRATPGMAPLSIVIPIRDRAGVDVRNALASLAWQTAGRPYEVIIVSHGSTPAVETELRSIAREAGATLIAVGSPDEPWCKPLALNTGILATDPAIAFVMMMDADMILADTMVATVLAELRGAPDKIVLCQSSDLPEDCVLPAEPSAIRVQFAELEQRAKLRGTYGTGGIQAVRRSFLVEVRGYDEDMLWWGALDTDLVRRAEASGLTPTWITERTAMLHQWHPRKHRVLDTATRKDEAQGAWLRNHELMHQRAKDVVRNPAGWGATIDQPSE
ncbi:MAG TPA: glycosyltransferase family 2 protein [Kofleriaceae bacterium]|jgi:hypothetical protein|nr:glycosyltransferase family 2 protein [Kofleriaceae bacterium]